MPSTFTVLTTLGRGRSARSSLIGLAVAVAGIACGADVPTASPPDVGGPSLAAAGGSGCYIVAGTISEMGVFPSFSGTISGDLVGTSQTTLNLDVRFTGAVAHPPGERTLTITGGTIPELVGRTVRETFEGLTISEAHPLARINERTRIVDGARTGNLTSHGTLNLGVFPWEVVLHYRGVICP